MSRNTFKCCDTAGWLIVELGLDGRADGARRQFAVGEQFEDAPADRVAQDIKRVHDPTLKVSTYISQAFIKPVQPGAMFPDADCTTSSRACWLAVCQDTAAG